MLPKCVYTAMVEVPTSFASFRRVRLLGPSSAMTRAAASSKPTRTVGSAVFGLIVDSVP